MITRYAYRINCPHCHSRLLYCGDAIYTSECPYCNKRIKFTNRIEEREIELKTKTTWLIKQDKQWKNHH